MACCAPAEALGLARADVEAFQPIRTLLSTVRHGRLHVRRAKNGSPSVHPLQGDEIRALRRLQREQEASPYVFT
jgi:hypothetical protein